MLPEGSMTEMPQRPASDRDMDASRALAAVREQFPALHCSRAELLGTGWGTEVYRLHDRLVGRFPRTAEAAQWISFEHTVLDLIASSLSPAFAVPSVVAEGKAGAHFPYPFLICTLVAGVAADAAISQSDELPADLGRALSRVHAVPLDRAKAAGLRNVEWNDSGYSGPVRVLHGDFRDGNLIVDPNSGRLVGVIDWGNAAVGDPALDFMTLVLWRGWDFVHQTLRRYDLPVDEEFLERVRYHAQTQALQWLTDAIRRRADPEPYLSWVRNAFSLIPDPGRTAGRPSWAPA